MPAAPALSLLFSSPLTSLSLSQDERLLVVGGLDVFSLIRFAEPGGAPAAPPQDMQTQYKRITDVCLNRVNEHLLACGTTRGGVDVFDLVNGTRVETLPASGRPHASAVNKLAWNPSDPNTLVTASSDATLSILDVRLREPVQCTLSPKSRDVRDVAFSPHELYSLAACFSNGTVKLFDYRHPKRCLHDVLAHDGMVRRVAVGGAGGAGWRPLTPVACPQAMCLAYHPTRRGVLASGGSSAREGAYNLKILAPEKDTQRATLQVLRTFGGVSNVAWRPSFDSQLAAAVDNSVMVWDVDEWTCAPLAQFEG
jgi:WD40 repeat protein